VYHILPRDIISAGLPLYIGQWQVKNREENARVKKALGQRRVPFLTKVEYY
jgi:hypothetical protein